MALVKTHSYSVVDVISPKPNATIPPAPPLCGLTTHPQLSNKQTILTTHTVPVPPPAGFLSKALQPGGSPSVPLSHLTS